MRRLTITNMKHVREWEPYRRLPRALVSQEHAISPCDTCAGHCCHHAAEMSAVEAVRIALTLVVPLRAFVTARAWEVLGKGFDVAGSHPILLDGGRMRLFLRREKGGPCHFLHEIDGRGRCVAYSVRPGVCRVYPYSFEEEGGARIAIGTTMLCETGWLYDDDTEESVARSLAAWREDLALDEELCARWNEGEREDRSFEAFARFAVEAAAPMLGLDAERLYPPERRSFRSRLTTTSA